MLSRSPSPSLFPDTPPMDDGFMVVPVWEPVTEVQIGSVVLEDPFLGFGQPPKETSPSPVRPPARKAFAVATADAAFVGGNAAPAPQPSPQPAPVPVQQPAPPQPQPLAHPPYPLYPSHPTPPHQHSHPVPYSEQPQPQPVPYAPPAVLAPVQPEPFRPPPTSESLSETNVGGGGLGWWEESGPVSVFAAALDAVDGVVDQHVHPTVGGLLEPLDHHLHFLDYPQEEEVTIGGGSGTEESPAATEADASLKSPEDILNEIYAEANQLETSASERSAEDDSPQSRWDADSESDGSPSPLDAAFDDAFRHDVLSAAEATPTSAGGQQAVLSLDAGSLPVEALRSGSQLNLVVHLKEPLMSNSRKRQGPKIRATVSIAPAPPAAKKKRMPGKGDKTVPSGTRYRKTEAKERKKAQNRVAATKYREKKRSARDVLLKELDEETERRERLRRQEEDALNEIAYLRDLLHKVQHKKSGAPEPHHEVVV